MNQTDALFTIDSDGHYVATDYSRGPWNAEHLHGGPVAALMTRAIEQDLPPAVDWTLVRVTVELERAVPAARPLRVERFTERAGRRICLTGATLADGDVIVARARGLHIRSAEISFDVDADPDVFPMAVEQSRPETMDHVLGGYSASYATSACEYRFATGSWTTPGAADLWVRLMVPVVPGEIPSGPQRAGAAADFGNGVSFRVSWDHSLFINPDLTVHLLRPPVGEWIGMRSVSHLSDRGTGLAESALYDEAGRIGRSLQSLLLDHR